MIGPGTLGLSDDDHGLDVQVAKASRRALLHAHTLRLRKVVRRVGVLDHVCKYITGHVSQRNRK